MKLEKTKKLEHTGIKIELIGHIRKKIIEFLVYLL